MRENRTYGSEGGEAKASPTLSSSVRPQTRFHPGGSDEGRRNFATTIPSPPASGMPGFGRSPPREGRG